MPFEIIWEPYGAYKRFYGFVTASEFKQSIEKLHNDLRFDILKYSINDYLGVQGHEITGIDVTMFAALGIGASFSNPNIRIASVTTEERILEFLQSYATTQLEPSHLGAFSNVADARTWIKGELAQ